MMPVPVILLVASAACSGIDQRGIARASDWRAAPDCGLVQVEASSAELDLSSVETMDVDSRGRIFLGDRLRSAVVVLSPDGRPLRTIGRAGAGPGEFGYVRNVQILPGDSLMVYDAEHYRLTVFAPDSSGAAYVRNFAGGPGAQPPNWVEKLPGERAFFATHRQAYSAAQDPADDYRRIQVVRLLEWDGRTRRDSVLMIPAGQPLIARQGRQVAATANPFGRPGLVRAGPQGRLFYGWGDSLTIAIHDLTGQRVGGFSLPHAGPPVTQADVEAAGEGLDEVLQRALREAAPERWPAFRNVVVDDTGHLWVGLLAPAGEPTRWTAFDEQGNARCVAPLPPNVDLRLVRGGRAYAVETDEMDVPRVVVYRVPPASDA